MIPRSSGYVIPMSVMADMLSTNNLNNRNVYNVLNGNKHEAPNVYDKELFADHKNSASDAMKVHFQIAERSLFYLNPYIHLRRIAYPSERVSP